MTGVSAPSAERVPGGSPATSDSQSAGFGRAVFPAGVDPTAMARNRRAVLGAMGAGLAGLAGCLGGGAGGTETCERTPPPTVESMPTPTLGSADATLTVSSFEDMSCPHCATFALEVLPKIREEYVDPGVVRFAHHDFPIPVDETWSWAAAGANRAVQDTQGDEAFFAFAHDMYERLGDYSEALVEDLAADHGADPCRVRQAAMSGTYRPVLAADRQRGLDAGVSGTPTVFVGGDPVQPTWDAIGAAIEERR